LDESGFEHDMPRTYGYSFKGQKCYGKYDWGNRKRTNAIGALLEKEFLTTGLFDITIDTNVFTTWIYEDLLPKLPKNSILVLDNAAFHKNKAMQDNIIKAGHTLEYLPPYSPDLNPIEHKWAQAKNLRRKYSCSVDQLFGEYCDHF
jgi:transposase